MSAGSDITSKESLINTTKLSQPSQESGPQDSGSESLKESAFSRPAPNSGSRSERDEELADSMVNSYHCSPLSNDIHDCSTSAGRSLLRTERRTVPYVSHFSPTPPGPRRSRSPRRFAGEGSERIERRLGGPLHARLLNLIFYVGRLVLHDWRVCLNGVGRKIEKAIEEL